MSVECPRCASYNADGALHCDQCGASLRGGGKGGGRGASVGVLIASAAMLIVAVAIFLSRGDDPPPDPAPDRARLEESSGPPRIEAPRATSAGTPAPLEPASELLAQDAEVAAGKLVAGWLQFESEGGAVLERVAVGASRGGWIAVPRQVALGGARWAFRPGLGGETVVFDGKWSVGERMGLWRIDSPDVAPAPPLEPWVEGEPVTFIAFSNTRRIEFDALGPVRREGLFLSTPVDDDLRSGGVLMQGSAIVGWGTGPRDGAERDGSALWLWAGEAGETLEAETTVDTFYDQTFVGGREEALDAAHAMAESGGAAEAAVLTAYGDALRLRPRLGEEDTRERWQPASAILPVARAMRALLDRDSAAVIVDAFGIEEVRLLGDGAVFLLWIDAVGLVDGAEAALALLDRYAAALIPVGSELEEPLVARIVAFLREGIARAIDDGDLRRAWAWVEDGRARFPDDPEIYLAEVELWLGEGNWQQGEQLLVAVSFPASFRERVARLERWISELKSAEGKIVIRFRPGAGSITTHADVSGVDQLFIVDTGASYTSIPWSTVNALGIRIDDNTPRRQLRTASDVIEVPVVVLPAITLGGWSVENVEATVLDLPGNESLGLLGLNFLGHFTVEVDRAAGRMTLAPK